MRTDNPEQPGFLPLLRRSYAVTLRRGLDFSGRSDLTEFWRFWIAYAALYMAAFLIDGAVSLLIAKFRVVRMLVVLGHILPNLALLTRRLHDIDRRGWFMVWPFVSVRALYQRGTPGPNRFGLEPVLQDGAWLGRSAAPRMREP